MKWKNRLTNYNFWISLVSAALLILQAFEFEFDIAYINEIATAVLGLLVVIGIISDPTKTYSSVESKKQENALNNPTQESKPEENVVEHETIQMPNEVEVKDINDNVENDFQILIDKISMDIKDNLAKISEIQNNILSEASKLEIPNETKLTVSENETKPETVVQNGINIVN